MDINKEIERLKVRQQRSAIVQLIVDDWKKVNSIMSEAYEVLKALEISVKDELAPEIMSKIKSINKQWEDLVFKKFKIDAEPNKNIPS